MGILGLVVGDRSCCRCVHIGVEWGDYGVVQRKFHVDEVGNFRLEGEETVGVYLLTDGIETVMAFVMELLENAV